MDDGWWYECSISYNMWCASEFTQAALAYEPFGVNFRDMHVPASYSPRVMLTSQLSGGNAPSVPQTASTRDTKRPSNRGPLPRTNNLVFGVHATSNPRTSVLS